MRNLNPDRLPAFEVALSDLSLDQLVAVRAALDSLFEFDEEGVGQALDYIIERRQSPDGPPDSPPKVAPCD